MLDRTQLARLGSIQEGVESRASCFEALRAVSSAEEMFYVPFLLNWDDPFAIDAIEWIVACPLCDAGTALAIYWLAIPEDAVGRPLGSGEDEWDETRIRVLRSIEARMATLDFPSSAIRYDPRAEWGHWDAEGNEHPRIADIPAQMKAPSPGTEPPDLGDLDLG